MRYWYLPLNLKVMDFMKALSVHDTLDLRMYSNYKFALGDIVFIYSGEPFRQILFKMEVTANDMPIGEACLDYYLIPPRPAVVDLWMRLRLLKAAATNVPDLGATALWGQGFRCMKSPHLILDIALIDYINRAFDSYSALSNQPSSLTEAATDNCQPLWPTLFD